MHSELPASRRPAHSTRFPRMSGQFFSAVDKELVEPNVVADVIPIAADVPAGTSAAPAPQQYATIAGHDRPTGGWVPAEAKPLLVGAAGGGLLTLLGVWIGYLLGRRG